METIEISITISNDHSKKTDKYYREKLTLSEDDMDLQGMIELSMRKFDSSLDIREFKPKVVVKTKCEV